MTPSPDPVAVTTAAGANAARNAEIQEVRRQIDILRTRLDGLEQQRERDVLLSKLKHDAVQYAPDLTPEQRQDVDILLAAIGSRNPLPFFVYVANNYIGVKQPPFVPTEMLGQKDIITALMKLTDFREGVEGFIRVKRLRVPKALNVADRETMMALYCKCPRLLEFASEEMKSDREAIAAMMRVTKNGVFSDLSRFISEALWNDKSVLLAVLTNNDFAGIGIEWSHIPATSSLRDDPDIAAAGLRPYLKNSKVCKTQYVFPQLSQRLRADRGIIKMALEGHERCCKYCTILGDCSGDINSDKEIVKMLCQRNGKELQHASYSLRGDIEVVMVACRNNGGALEFCAPDLLPSLDRSFIRACIKNRGSAVLKALPAEMQDDEDVVLDALCNDFIGQYDGIPDTCNMKTCKSFLLKALSKCPVMYANMPQSLRSDCELLRTALMSGADDVFVEMSWHDLEDFEKLFSTFPQFRSDKELIISIMNQGAWHDNGSFEDDFFVDELLPTFSFFANDLEFMLAACKQDARCIRAASDELKIDFRVVESALTSKHRAIHIIDEVPEWAQLQHPDLVVKFLEETDFGNENVKEVFDAFPHQIWLEHKCAKAVAATYENALLYLPEKYRSDHEVVLAAISRSHHAFNMASSPLKSDAEFVRLAIEENYRCLLSASTALKDGFFLQVAAVAKSEQAVSCITSNGWTSRARYDATASRDFDAKIAFAKRVREAIAVKEAFVLDFLRGIDICKSSSLPSNLVSLSLGNETSIIFKRLIAEFAGIPLGRELHDLKKASEYLVLVGF